MFQIYCRKFQSVSGGQLSKFLVEALSVSSTSGRRAVWVNKRPGDRQADISFADDVDVLLLAPLIEGRLEFENELIKCSEAKTVNEPKKVRRCISDLVLPWSHIPYEEQLVRKKDSVTSALAVALEGVCASAKARSYCPLPTWPDLVGDETLAPVCNTHYRNKCEFSFGSNSDGAPEIGFVLSRATHVSEPVIAQGEDLPHVSLGISKIVKSLRELLKEIVNEFSLFSHLTKKGWWRICMIRACPNSGEVQVLLQVGSQEDSSLCEKFEKELTHWASSNAVTSLYVQYNGSVTDTIVMSELHELKLLLGPPTIRMELGPVSFQTNPMSFFQTNSAAAEILMTRVKLHCSLATVLFDVCCGVGTIGQFVANAIPVELFGVDIVEEAICDAAANAHSNNLSNAQYVAGRAEKVLPEILSRYKNSGIVCVVDPPRSGLHKSVIAAIRENEAIKTLIYVSCNPSSLATDLVKFCEPLTSSSAEEGLAVSMRFVPARYVAVDMFPNTPHCEAVVLLTR